MRALILGGTAESRELALLLLQSGWRVTSSLAGRVKEPKLPLGEVRIGGFGGPPGLARWLMDHEVDLVVDATHPFAEKISISAAEATRATGIPLIALHRPAWTPENYDEWIYVNDMEETARTAARQPRAAADTADKANAASKSLFVGGGDMSNVPTYILRPEDYRDGTIDLSGVLVVSGLSNTRSEARRNIEQGGVSIEGEVIKDVKKTFTKEDFAGEGLLIKRGKKNFCKVKSE